MNNCYRKKFYEVPIRTNWWFTIYFLFSILKLYELLFKKMSLNHSKFFHFVAHPLCFLKKYFFELEVNLYTFFLCATKFPYKFVLYSSFVLQVYILFCASTHLVPQNNSFVIYGYNVVLFSYFYSIFEIYDKVLMFILKEWF